MSREWIGPNVAARIAGVAPRTIQKWADAGLFASSRMPDEGNRRKATHRRIHKRTFFLWCLSKGLIVPGEAEKQFDDGKTTNLTVDDWCI